MDFTQHEALVKSVVDAEKALETTTAADDAAQAAATNAAVTAASTASARSSADSQFHQAVSDLYNFLFPPPTPPVAPAP